MYGFDLGGILGALVFLAAVCLLIRAIWIGIKTRREDRDAPVLTVPARVERKREIITRQDIPNGGDTTGAMGYHTIETTRCRVVFQAQSGETLEFAASQAEYKELEEGQEGALTFQGSRYLGFKYL